MKGFYTFKRCWSLLVVTIFAFASSFGQTVAKIGSTEYTSLQAAVDAATSDMTGDVTIELINDITGYTIVHQKAGLNLTIDGNNKAVFAERPQQIRKQFKTVPPKETVQIQSISTGIRGG